jgi:two-component system chemotaxis response regulator CheB
VVCIGSSIGGPPVLETILAAIPANFDVPIIIAQHMPEVFTRTMAQRLNDISELTVVHAESGMQLQRRHVYVAPGGKHTHIQKMRLAHWQLLVNNEPTTVIYKPSAYALFESAAQAHGRRIHTGAKRRNMRRLRYAQGSYPGRHHRCKSKPQ